MKSFLDFEEKNVEKAVQKACDQLNISREKLKYDIISHGSSGIFGLVGARKALIRVFIPDASLRQFQSEIFNQGPKLYSKTTPSDSSSNIKTDASALVDEAFGGTTTAFCGKKKPSLPPKKGKLILAKNKLKHSPSSKNKRPVPFIPKTAEPDVTAVPQKTSDSFSENLPQPSVQSPEVQSSEVLTDLNQEVSSLSSHEIALQLSKKILSVLAENADLSFEPTPDCFKINIKAPEPGSLIGKKGQTLEAIQYLVDKVVSKHCGKGVRVLFDVEGYVETRITELADLANRMAAHTLNTGKPTTMMRMNAHDRRIVHITLKNHPEVRTQSIGDGYYRKLIIFPKKKPQKRPTNTPASEKSPQEA